MGDEQAFTDYATARRDAVRRTAYLLCGDWYWADDLTQATFIRLAAHWKRIREPEAVHGWVRVTLLRLYLAEKRRHRERPSDAVPERPTIDPSADTVLRLTFAEALRHLAPRQRATVICRYYHGLDVAETAAALRCSTGTVKSQTARALTHLRSLLGESLQLSEVSR